MYDTVQRHIRAQLDEIRESGLHKEERVLQGPQGAHIKVGGRQVLCFCANNYLGLSSDPGLIAAAEAAMRSHGLGLSSVRFICGTQDLHKQLEQKVLGTEDTILYTSCFDANGGLFETLLGPEGRDHLRRPQPRLDHRRRPAVQGEALPLRQQRHGGPRALPAGSRTPARGSSRPTACSAWTASSPSCRDLRPGREVRRAGHGRRQPLHRLLRPHRPRHAGTPRRAGPRRHHHVTFGKALGGASGGFTSGRSEIIELLRQRSRPYLFSNTVAPAIVGATIACLDLLSATTALRDKLAANTAYFRAEMTAAGFDIVPGEHPIVPIMLGDARRAVEMASKHARQRHLRHRLLVPGRPEGPGPDPRPDQRRARNRAP